MTAEYLEINRILNEAWGTNKANLAALDGVDADHIWRKINVTHEKLDREVYDLIAKHCAYIEPEKLQKLEAYVSHCEGLKPTQNLLPKEKQVASIVDSLFTAAQHKETPSPKVDATTIETEVEKVVETAEKSFGKKYGVAIGVGAAAVAAAGYAVHVSNRRKEAETAPLTV